MGDKPRVQAEYEKLLEAKEKAEIASRAKSEFLAAVSHELRIPLTGIIGMAQLLSIDCLLPGQKEQVEDILKASEHLLSVVNDLLDIAQLEAGKMELHPAPTNLKILIEELVNMLSFQASLKGLELLTNYAEDVPQQVMVDARALRQVLLNLVGNALKFTEKGYILIQVKCLQRTPEGALLEFNIQDTGIGIPEDKRVVIFDRFAQVDASYSRRYGGAGLGLTLTKHLVELMGGHIQVISDIGKGSNFTFSILFPLQERAITGQKNSLEKPKITQNVFLDRQQSAQSTTLPRILLVEDDLMVQKVHKRMLEKMGCIVEVAKDGKEAVAMSKNNYDLIFMDVGLPEMSGLEATKKIRRREGSGKHIPIVAMTAYVHEEDKNNCLAVGMDDVATKPISPVDLQKILVRWVLKPAE